MLATRGSFLYYVSDKNIFDALSQSMVDNETVRGMFERRNILCSRQTPREALAGYFSSLTHDLMDHRDIAARLGAATRRERTTSLDIGTPIEADHLTLATDKLVASLKGEGDAVHVSKDGSSLTIFIKYSEVDYRRSEFRQLQHRDGVIELVKEDSGWVLRSTQSDHINAARDDFVRELQQHSKAPIETSTVSLFEYPSAKVRSKFFYDLMNELPGFVRRDVTDVYVHKVVPKLSTEPESDGEEEDGDIQRVLMRGTAVTRSKLLLDLLKEDKYYIFRVAWLATETLGKGYVYAIEALFHDAEDCSGFSYLVRGVHPLDEAGKISKHRRIPTKSESDAVARAVEAAARKLVRGLAHASGATSTGSAGEKV